MGKRLRKTIKIIDGISEVSGTISSYFLIIIMLIITYETVMRYFFNSPTIWAHESCQILFAIYGLSIGANSLLHNVHVRMDLLYSRLSLKSKAILDIATMPLFYFWTVLLFIYGGKFALESMSYWERSTSVWSPPVWEVKLAIPVAAFLLILQGTAILIRNVFFVLGREDL